MSCFIALPDEVVKLILQYVPFKHRMSSCSLVCRRLGGLAAAATQHFRLTSPLNPISTQQAQSALEWIQQYGQQLTSVELSFFPLPPQQLPAGLSDLRLGLGCRVELAPAAQRLTKLTRLELGCSIIDQPQQAGLGALAHLVHLQHLVVVPWDQEPPGVHPQFDKAPISGLPAATLPCLQHLTSLAVDSLSAENLLQLGALTRLAELEWWAEGGWAVGPPTDPGVVLPAALTRLKLSSPVQARVLFLLPPGLQHLEIAAQMEGNSCGRESFLSGMARLTRLTRLAIGGWQVPLPPPCAAYSALTCSSKLASLSIHGVDIAPGFWLHVFPAARVLPHLTYLCATDPLWDDALPWACSAADVSRLVTCCPGLCRIGGVPLQHGPHVSELRKLTALTSCRMQYTVACGTDDLAAFAASLRGLAAVTQLRDLDMAVHGDVDDLAALLPLTSLAGLTSFMLCVTPDEDGDMEPVDLHLKKVDSGPDVCWQLLRHCADGPGCPSASLYDLAQQLAQQQALAAEQQERVADLERQLAGKQQVLEAQHEVIQQQQRQIAELRAQLEAQTPTGQC